MTTLVPESGPSADTLADLAAAVSGRVLLPESPDYPALATPWNVAAASLPIAVVQVADSTDVATTVRYANRVGLEVSVQATGHGAYPLGRPTILIQTGLLTELSIDRSGTARVGAGVRWQQVLDAAAPFGFGALAGSAPHVGVVGYLTGGGMSPVSRTFGYASDHVTAFDVVTGDGEVRRASATRNPALFWGLRGGKGALGIVTAVEFDLVPVADIYGGCLYFDGADTATVFHAWSQWTTTLPREASSSLAILRLPEMPMVPPPLAGRTTVAVRFAWIGDPDDGARTVAPMNDVAPVLLGGMGVMPFAAMGSIHADPVDPMPVQEKMRLLRELPADAVDAILAVVGPDTPSPQVIVELRLLGGAIADEPSVPSAVSHRDAAYTVMAIGIDAPPIAEATAANSAELVAAVAPWSDGVGQPNFAPSADPATAMRNYDAATLTRLATLAATYDPNGVIAASRTIRSACAATH